MASDKNRKPFETQIKGLYDLLVTKDRLLIIKSLK